MQGRLSTLVVFAIAICSLTALAQSPAPPTNPASDLGQIQEVQPMNAAPVIPLSSTDVEALELNGDRLREEKDFLQAIDYYSAALRLKPTAVVHNKLGMAYIGLRRWDKAADSVKRAIHMDKKYAEAYNNLGAIYHMKQKYNNAIKNYKKAIALNDQSASFHSNIGTSYIEKKDYTNGIKEYQRAYLLDPGVFERSSRGGITARLTSPEDRARYSYFLARVFAQNGNSDKALFYLRKAIEDGYPDIKNVYKDAEFATLRKDERFTEMMSAKTTTIPQ
jgi:tetratricopeptide (TPR) repeat protein